MSISNSNPGTSPRLGEKGVTNRRSMVCRFGKTTGLKKGNKIDKYRPTSAFPTNVTNRRLVMC